MDKPSHAQQNVEWNFHPTLYDICNYFIHVWAKVNPCQLKGSLVVVYDVIQLGQIDLGNDQAPQGTKPLPRLIST